MMYKIGIKIHMISRIILQAVHTQMTKDTLKPSINIALQDLRVGSSFAPSKEDFIILNT